MPHPHTQNGRQTSAHRQWTTTTYRISTEFDDVKVVYILCTFSVYLVSTTHSGVSPWIYVPQASHALKRSTLEPCPSPSHVRLTPSIDLQIRFALCGMVSNNTCLTSLPTFSTASVAQMTSRCSYSQSPCCARFGHEALFLVRTVSAYSFQQPTVPLEAPVYRTTQHSLDLSPHSHPVPSCHPPSWPKCACAGRSTPSPATTAYSRHSHTLDFRHKNETIAHSSSSVFSAAEGICLADCLH